MKKVVVFTLAFAGLIAFPCLPATALDWELPVWTMRYELAQGSREDPDEELMFPSSIRNTVSLRMKEVADPAVFNLTMRYSLKDYYLNAGDYSYLEIEHEQSWRLADSLKLGFTLGGKNVDFPEPGETGLQKSYLSLKGGSNVIVELLKGTNLEGGLSTRYDLARDPAREFQAYVASMALSTRLDDWHVSARYRGEFRLPLGEASAIARSAYNTCSLSLQWDPN